MASVSPLYSLPTAVSDPYIKGLSGYKTSPGRCCGGRDLFERQGKLNRLNNKIIEVRGIGPQPLNQFINGRTRKLTSTFSAFAVRKGSAKSSESEETIPSWADPDSDEPPPWARDDGKQSATQQSFEIPFYIYLLGSAVTAIAAIGSAFENLNNNPVFGVLESDNGFYAPLLGFFFFTGIPTSGFLWVKSVQAANKEAEEQDKRDGFL